MPARARGNKIEIRLGMLRGKSRRQFHQALESMANLAFGSAVQSEDTERIRLETEEFLRRTDSSDGLRSLRQKRSISVPALDLVLIACTEAYAHKLVIETASLDEKDLDPMARGVSTVAVRKAIRTLRSAEDLLRNPVEGVQFGDLLVDNRAADRIAEVSQLYEAVVVSRERRKKTLRTGSGPNAGAPIAPETVLGLRVDRALSMREPSERLTIAKAPIQDVLGVSISIAKLRERLRFHSRAEASRARRDSHRSNSESR